MAPRILENERARVEMGQYQYDEDCQGEGDGDWNRRSGDVGNNSWRPLGIAIQGIANPQTMDVGCQCRHRSKPSEDEEEDSGLAMPWLLASTSLKRYHATRSFLGRAC